MCCAGRRARPFLRRAWALARRAPSHPEKESPPDLPGGCTAGQDPAEMVGGMHRRTDA